MTSTYIDIERAAPIPPRAALVFQRRSYAILITPTAQDVIDEDIDEGFDFRAHAAGDSRLRDIDARDATLFWRC